MQYKNPNYKNASAPRRSVKKRLFLLAAVLLVAGGVLAALELTDTTYLFHDRPVQVTGGPGTKGVPANDQETEDNADGDGTDTPAADGNSDKGGGNTSTKLEDIQALFVSAHTVPRNAPINSTCSTTSGASCQIIFTKGDVTKTLPAQTTDKGGATYWNGWKPQDIGLTTGEWNITAKATLGSQTKTAADALPLKVTQ